MFALIVNQRKRVDRECADCLYVSVTPFGGRLRPPNPYQGLYPWTQRELTYP